MILPESQLFVWSEEEWRKHIESVVLLVGLYENDKRIVRRTTMDKYPWAVTHREGNRWSSSELYDNLDDAICNFMSMEELPPLDGIPQSTDYGMRSQLTSDAKSIDFEKFPEQSRLTLLATEESEEDMCYYAEYKVVKRQVYHVVPAENGWEVKKEGNKRPSAKARLKVDAIKRAKKLAKNAKLGQVIIHKRNGKIQTEYTYGDDPRKTKG